MEVVNRFQDQRVLFGIRQLENLPGDKPLYLRAPEEKQPAQAMDGQAYCLEADDCGLTLYGHPQGLMYGMIDLADALRWGVELPWGLHTPYLQERGVKFNIPLDARTPSYSDASDSAWNNIPVVWEWDFWTEVLDFLALHKYNAVSLWNLNPFPSMVRTPGFYRAALEDVMRSREPVSGAGCRGFGMYTRTQRESLETVRVMTMDEKIDFWRRVMQYGADRGIRFFIFTWNVFVYGTEEAGYGLTDDMGNPATRAYVRKSVEEMILTYPLLAGIGVTAGERMSSGRGGPPDEQADEEWLMDTYGKGINAALAREAGRQFRFIHRQHMTGASSIETAFSTLKIPVEFSFKYSQAHMYSDPVPHFSDAFYAGLKEGQKTWLTLRNDDLYLLRWGGVAYARAYLAHIPAEKTAGFMMGPDGYTIGRDWAARDEAERLQPVLIRQWYQTAIFGELGYDPALPDAHFLGLIQRHTGCEPYQAQRLFRLGETVSWLIPLVNQVHWHDFDFQNYPEANMGLDWYHAAGDVSPDVLWHGIHDFLLAPAQPGGNTLSIAQTAAWGCQAAPPGKRTAEDVAREIFTRVSQARELLKEQDDQPLPAAWLSWRADCEALAELGEFFGCEISCALTVKRAMLGVEKDGYDRAVDLARQAAVAFSRYAEQMERRFFKQRLTRLNGRVADFFRMCEEAWRDVGNVMALMEPYR